jgi:hypothetical protein
MNPTPNPQYHKKLPPRGHKSSSEWEVFILCELESLIDT